MANTTVTSIGRVNNTSATPLALGTAYDTKYATYLKLFSGEMFKAYESATIAKGTVQSRTLKNGKAMQFIFTGRMEAAWTWRAYTQRCVYDNRVNSGKPKARAMAILSQANQAWLEGATTTWWDTILSRNTWLAPDNSMSWWYSLNCTKV